MAARRRAAAGQLRRRRVGGPGLLSRSRGRCGPARVDAVIVPAPDGAAPQAPARKGRALSPRAQARARRDGRRVGGAARASAPARRRSSCLRPGLEGERAVARFEREVQLTAGLTHRSRSRSTTTAARADGVFYYAMELLDGINLQQLVAHDGPLPPARVVHILRQACGALAEAHAAGLIHRDIKPANIMLCVYGGMPDFVKVLDFGLVKDIAAPDEMEQAGRGGRAAPDDATLSQDGSPSRHTSLHVTRGHERPHEARRAGRHLCPRGGGLLPADRVKPPFPGRTAIEIFKLERHGDRRLPRHAPRAFLDPAALADDPAAVPGLRARGTGRPRPRPSTPCWRPAGAPKWTVAEARALVAGPGRAGAGDRRAPAPTSGRAATPCSPRPAPTRRADRSAHGEVRP